MSAGWLTCFCSHVLSAQLSGAEPGGCRAQFASRDGTVEQLVPHGPARPCHHTRNCWALLMPWGPASCSSRTLQIQPPFLRSHRHRGSQPKNSLTCKKMEVPAEVGWFWHHVLFCFPFQINTGEKKWLKSLNFPKDEIISLYRVSAQWTNEQLFFPGS